jgi:hypothetical protein
VGSALAPFHKDSRVSKLQARRWARRVALFTRTAVPVGPAAFGARHNGGPVIGEEATAPLSSEAILAALRALQGLETVRVTFAGPLPEHACGAVEVGEISWMGRMPVLFVKRSDRFMGSLPIYPLHQLPVMSIEIVRNRADAQAEHDAHWFGERLVPEMPTTPDGFRLALELLADALVAHAPLRPGNDVRRRYQLERQMYEIAEAIGMSKAKRLYLLTAAQHRLDGTAFDLRKMKNRFLRTSMDVVLPQDFDPDRAIRTNRTTRRAIKMADPVHAELVFMAKRMRRSGLDVRQPANGDCLVIRFPMSSGVDVAFVYRLGADLRTPTIDRNDASSATALRREARARKTEGYERLERLRADRAAELRAMRPASPPESALAQPPDPAPAARPAVQLSLF